MSDPVLIVLCTCPDAEAGSRLARLLVEERLAACVNRIDGLTSAYRWEGRLEESAESLLVIKTTAGAYGNLEARLQALHPYEVPEILAIPVTSGLGAYLDWVGQEVEVR